jgi:lipopolysaccharide/colanic/teichoic acid biosynthesis glycosyltransferase
MATPKPALSRQEATRFRDSVLSRSRAAQVDPVEEAEFIQILKLERRRAERSEKPFILMLLGSEDFHEQSGGPLVRSLSAAISSCTRETDVLGWYEQGQTLGLLLTEVGQTSESTLNAVLQKVSVAVRRAVDADQYRRINIRFRFFPQHSTNEFDDDERMLYPDITREQTRSWANFFKRALDILGTLFALVAFLPLFAVIPLLIKMTSKGPVLFCQTRVGQFGREFKFYKFRSMHVSSDPTLHEEYVTKLIAGHKDVGQSNGTYKLTNDPRVTPIGRILRKTSLDELPQFINVLLNDMSLVGPRPPLPYEYKRYRAWHKRRVLELKPGITGIWQVEGRSRTTFDEMVRLDLKYSYERSLWLDLKLLIQTPVAMFSGNGAY